MTRRLISWRRLFIVLMALAGMAATFSLGRWQLDRAAESLASEAMQRERARQPALDGVVLDTARTPAQRHALMHRTFVLRGRWLTDRTVFLDNRQMNKRSGFIVLTPLQLTASPTVVLVQRGWAPRNFLQRDALPAVQTPAGEVQVRGQLAERPTERFALAADQGGQIRQNLDLDAFRAETGLALAAAIVVQTGAASEGLLREWPAPASMVNTHNGYAFQWFGMCALISLLFVWFQLVRPVYRSHRR